MFAALYLPDFALQAALRTTPELHRATGRAARERRGESDNLAAHIERGGGGRERGDDAEPGRWRVVLSLTIKSRARAQEKIAGEILLHHAGTLSPEIEATAPGVCTVHFTARKNCREQCRASRQATGPSCN